ncbi:DUF2254 domain-containing protein [Salibacterium salarium]|uniref:DUF2254 domain-containing protein n=1 Tax=Salibacterium salarium TaxID=284579 RepID=A0A3R9P0E7_9BACI|nr:DUF2254 domain-containing protein [Salibacterium salarium]RSL30148.1 DUF2254 domain-containing protein [Salibacterium salarium]
MLSFKSVLKRIRSNFLYIPSLYGITAFIFALISIYLDTYLLNGGQFQRWIPSPLFINIDLARTILGSISAALLTMTTITFSTILVVLTTYISNFSPRTLQNFISDPNTQRVLGFFVAGIIYSILLLLLLQESDTVTQFISPSFAVFFAILCIFVFVFFIHHVSSWIQVSSLLHYITQQSMKIIENDLTDEKDVQKDSPWEDWEGEDIKHITPRRMTTDHSGYIQQIDIKGLVEQASKDDCIVRINTKISEYIESGGSYLSLWELSKPCDKDSYKHHITIGPEKSSSDTIELSLVKIVEIAVRALSPGINDPNTAINCINNLGKILAKLGNKHLPRSYHNDKDRNLRVIMDKPTFSDYLYKCFAQIRHYGFQDISVLASGIHAFILIAETNTDDIKEEVWEFTEYVIEGIDTDNLLSLDKRYINEQLQTLATACSHRESFYKL